jgi:hypothetical protein
MNRNTPDDERRRDEEHEVRGGGDDVDDEEKRIEAVLRGVVRLVRNALEHDARGEDVRRAEDDDEDGEVARLEEEGDEEEALFKVRVARAAAEEQHHALVHEKDPDEETRRPSRVRFKVARNERRQDEEEAHEGAHE